MSTKRQFNNETLSKQYKKLLAQAEGMRGESGEKAFERITILDRVFNDTEFRADNGVVDDTRLAAVLDKYVDDLALRFFDLRAMLKHFPLKSQWEAGLLRTMHDEVVASRYVPPVEKPVIRRDCATVAQVEKLKDDNRRATAQLKQEKKRVAELQVETKTVATKVLSLADENKALKKENADLKRTVAKLESENAKLRERLKENRLQAA